MKIRDMLARIGLIAIPLVAAQTLAQVPVDDDGNLIGDYEPQSSVEATGNENIPLLTSAELEELVGPVALYPDDLLAVVLPAAAYPLQIVEAQRFLEALESDPSLEPDEDWDDSIVALLNYPEVVDLLNEDLDWTWRLGEAVVAQQDDVITAVEDFRNRAYAAGNLQTDEYQSVTHNDGVIEITPVSEEVIYVPYYEPERVVVYQPAPVYYYYPRPCPVYYYPYSSNYAFHRGFFWGVTTAFTIGWHHDRLSVFHHSYSGHPYYGRYYRDYWWYRRPTINVYNTIYVDNRGTTSSRRYTRGDEWRPSRNTRLHYSNQRITRNTYQPGTGSSGTVRQTRVQTSNDIGNQIRDRLAVSSHGRTGANVRSNSERRSEPSIRPDAQPRSGSNVRPGNRQRGDSNVRPAERERGEPSIRQGNRSRSDSNVRPNTEPRSGSNVRPSGQSRSNSNVRPSGQTRPGSNVSPPAQREPRSSSNSRAQREGRNHEPSRPAVRPSSPPPSRPQARQPAREPSRAPARESSRESRDSSSEGRSQRNSRGRSDEGRRGRN